MLKDGAIKVLHSVCQQIWKMQQWLQDRKRSILIPVPKKGSTKECANHQIIALISQASKVMLNILHNIATLIVCVFVLVAPSYLVSHIHPAKSMRYE